VDGPDRLPGIRPRATLGRRLDQLARASFPAVCTLVLMFLSAAPLGLPMQAALLPALTLGSVWFWALFRPAALPPPLVFMIGVLLDLLGYMPLGSGVLILLIVYGVAVRTRRKLARQPFAVVWAVFAALAVGAAALGWGLTSLLQFVMLPPSPALFQAVLTVAVYPVLSLLFGRAHASVADPGRA
jgi:rod shape-determining protein MreD